MPLGCCRGKRDLNQNNDNEEEVMIGMEPEIPGCVAQLVEKNDLCTEHGIGQKFNQQMLHLHDGLYRIYETSSSRSA